MALKVLFIGGTGQISLAAVREAVAAGHRVTVFNRGRTAAELPAGVEAIAGDMADAAAYGAAVDGRFDVVCQFMVFTPAEMARDIATFAGKTGQYVFISTASAYQKPARHYVITEKTPLENPYWDYSRQKAACEWLLREQSALPYTIVRPSHTVRTRLPSSVGDGDTVARRLLNGRPVIVAGDGMSLWTLTRAADFSVPFVKLFGNGKALGEDFHITGDRSFTWDQIHAAIADGLGVKAEIVHVPSDTLVRYRPEWEGGLFGDKMWPVIFDNSKVKSVAGPFTCAERLDAILAEPLAAFRARQQAGGGRPSELDALFDRIAAEQSALGRG
jgi:nucleoside-diphosphate-sugar epimerase